jgi:hypothetical protein
MAICGYNEKIGSGLSMLIAGMAEAIEQKARLKGAPAAVERELIELDAMIETMSVGGASRLVKMFVGLNIFARELFAGVEAADSLAVSQQCHEIGQRFVTLLEATEKRNQETGPGPNGEEDAQSQARSLAVWVMRHGASAGVGNPNDICEPSRKRT